MSERKYRQRGYQDQAPRERERQRPAPAPARGEPRQPNMPGFKQVVRCARCGGPVSPPIGLEATCGRCGADLHACAQCGSFDTGSRFECLQPIPERVTPKDHRNACPLFEPRVTVERETGSTRPTDARRAFDDLFK